MKLLDALISMINQRERHTEFREKEEEHSKRGDESNNAAGECTAVEILVDFGIGVQTL